MFWRALKRCLFPSPCLFQCYILSVLPSNMYVVESTGIEGIVILQDENGTIYSAAPNQEPQKIYDSLADYLIESI